MNALNRLANATVALVVVGIGSYLAHDRLAEFVNNATTDVLAFSALGVFVSGIVVVGCLTLSPRRI